MSPARVAPVPACPTCDRGLETRAGVRQHHTEVHMIPLANRTCSGCDESFYNPPAKREYCARMTRTRASTTGTSAVVNGTPTARTVETRFGSTPPRTSGGTVQRASKRSTGSFEHRTPKTQSGRPNLPILRHRGRGSPHRTRLWVRCVLFSRLPRSVITYTPYGPRPAPV